MEQASKEGLVPFNVAGKATLPKVEKKEVNYFQPEQVAAIRETLETEPIKWRMLLITGARRGEILGLKWDKVDFEAEHKAASFGRKLLSYTETLERDCYSLCQDL